MFEEGSFAACAVSNAVQHTILFWTDEVKKDEFRVIAPCNQKYYLWVYLDLARSCAVLWDSDPH